MHFALLTFLAAIGAYFAALGLGLELPFWSFATVYIVAHPTSGMLRAKALWRIGGTCAGALYTVLLLARLPVGGAALGAALALWIGLCMWFALRDRAPRNYSFMLAGYTTVLIVFPSLTLHEAIGATAFARAAEVLIGCLSAWLFGGLLARRTAAGAAGALFEAWRADALALARRALCSAQPVDGAELARQATQIHWLLRHARYESGAWRDAVADTGRVPAAEAEMAALIPIIDGLWQRRTYLQRRHPQWLARFQAPVAQLLAALETGAGAGSALRALERADRELAQAQPQLVELRPFLLRVHQFGQAWQALGRLRGQLAPPRVADEAAPGWPPGERDAAARGALCALLATWITYEMWRHSHWEPAAIACMFGAMASSLFPAGQAGAVRKILDYMAWSTLGVALAGVYLYAVFPRSGALWLLPPVLGAVYIPLGCWLAEPKWAMRIMPLAAVAAGQLGFLHGHEPTLSTFVLAWLAQCLGIGVAAALAWLLAPSNAQHLRASQANARRDILAALANYPGRRHPWLRRRSLGRIVDAAERHGDAPEALASLSAYHRILINVQQLERALAPAGEVMVRVVRRALRAHFRCPHGTPVSAPLLARLRRVACALNRCGDPAEHEVAVVLAGIEIDLVSERGEAGAMP